MSTLAWILVVIAIIAVIAALFAAFRTRQRKGDVFAAAPAGRDGGSQ